MIRYAIAAYQINGKSFLFFGVWEKHIGMYPIYPGHEDFEREVAPFRTTKATLQFPLGKPIDHALIEGIVKNQLAHTQVER